MEWVSSCWKRNDTSVFLLNTLALWFMVAALLAGQPADAQNPATDFHFENITTAQGLSSNDITCIYQDRKGFLWVGTHFGLNRYDGQLVQTYYHEVDNPNSLSGNDVTDILEDRSGIIWIATKDGGLTRFDPDTLPQNQFRQFQNDPANPHSIAVNRLTCLFDYNDEYLLAGAENVTGVFVNKRTFEFSYPQMDMIHTGNLSPLNAQPHPAKISNWIQHIVRLDNSLCVSFLIGGFVYKLSAPAYQFNIAAKVGNESTAYSVSSFLFEGEKAWLAAWRNGLFLQYGLLEDTTHFPVQEKVVDVNDEVLCLEKWSDDFVIAGTKSSGLLIVNRQNYAYTNLHHSLLDAFTIASDRVNCLLKDRDGILWVGTSNGLSKYNPDQWQFHACDLLADPKNELIHFSIFEDPSGELNVCTSAGIFKCDPEQRAPRLMPVFENGEIISPTCIIKTDDDRYFLGSESRMFQFNLPGGRIEQIDLKAMNDSPPMAYFSAKLQVRSVIKDSINGNPFLILAILGDGLGFYDLQQHRLTLMIKMNAVPRSLGNNLVRAVTRDHDGNIWVGTSGGLYRWRRSFPLQNDFEAFLHQPGNDSSLSGNEITGLLVDSKNQLWISTNGTGLNKFTGTGFKHYFAPTVTGNKMTDLVEDNQDRIWIATASGFLVFYKKSENFKEVTLANADWILKPPARMLKRSNGSISYGAGNFLVTFNPDSFRMSHAVPQIYLTAFNVMGNDISLAGLEKDALSFPYYRNFISFSFSALQLSQPGMVRYQYWLKGLEETWSEAVQTGHAVFTSLPPGKFEFYVRSTVATGEWGKPVMLAAFEIRNPFWYTWWFLLISLATMALIIYIIIRVRLQQLMRLHEVRTRIATDLHDDIGSALSSISISSQLVKKFSTHEDERVDRILNRINTTSRETLESMSDIVWAINPQNDSGKNMVMKMQRVLADLLESKGIGVEFSVDPRFESMKLNMDGRKNLYLIFKEAVNNISKHSSCKNARVQIQLTDRMVTMRVEDDGNGFIVTKSRLGNGLDSMKFRASQLHAVLHVESEEGKGTRLVLETTATKIRD